MNVLMVGGAGHVGTILRPALESEHDCRCFDRTAVVDMGDRSIVGDTSDDQAIAAALVKTDAVVYLAMGARFADPHGSDDVDAAFDVNVRDAYRWLSAAMQVGASHFIYASSFSVYRPVSAARRLDESVRPEAFRPYGISKRLGEYICEAGAQQYPEATIMVLRLFMPRNEVEWKNRTQTRFGETGPEDTRRLFRAALQFRRPGYHLFHASGDVSGQYYPNDHAAQCLHWRPCGE